MPDIVSVKEIWKNRGGGTGDGGERGYTRTFRVITSDAKVGSIPVRTAVGIPRRYDSYVDQKGNTDVRSFCKSVNEQQDDTTPWVWLVTCTYSSRQEEPDPLARLPEYEWSSTKWATHAEYDTAGAAIVNKAGDAFDPPVEFEGGRLVLTISRNEGADNSLVVQQNYWNRVNKTKFQDCDPKQVKLSEYTCKRVVDYDKGTIYYACKYVFELRGETWKAKPLNRGFSEIKAPGQQRTIMRDAYGAPYSSPQLLDANGKKLPVGGAPVFGDFNIYYDAEFNDLGFI